MNKTLTILFFILCFFSFAQEKKHDSIEKTVEKQIEEVEIRAKKKLIERKVDRLVFKRDSVLKRMMYFKLIKAKNKK